LQYDLAYNIAMNDYIYIYTSDIYIYIII